MDKHRLKERFPVAASAARVLLRPVRALLAAADRRHVAEEAAFKETFDAFSQAARLGGDSRFELSWELRMPILNEATATTGYDAHYVYHTSWAARLLARNRPAIHCDFASDIRFATLVSAFVPIVFYDYRPLLVQLPNLSTERADLLNLPLAPESVISLSCMHVVEHVGLGRYGDSLNPQGDLEAIRNLKKILAPGGDIYFVVPIGRPALRFNAHRIYSYDMIADYFSEYSLMEFALVTDVGTFIPEADRELAKRQQYGCGCFWFRK